MRPSEEQRKEKDAFVINYFKKDPSASLTQARIELVKAFSSKLPQGARGMKPKVIAALKKRALGITKGVPKAPPKSVLKPAKPKAPSIKQPTEKKDDDLVLFRLHNDEDHHDVHEILIRFTKALMLDLKVEASGKGFILVRRVSV